MKKILTLLTLAILSFGLAAFDAEARRFGGGKSIGKQREAINQQAAPKPAQTPAAAPGSAAAGGSKWMGPLAGLAAGGLLAALFMGGAFEGINMMDVLMLAALMAAVFFVVRMLRRPRQEHSARPMQYSGMGTDAGSAAPSAKNAAAGPATGAATGASAGASAPRMAAPVTGNANIPADFQVEPFLRNAKTSFIRLQAANDARDLSDIREYTTPEMFAEISMQINERGNEAQRTEVMAINAELLEVVTEKDAAIASVRFNGQLRESGASSPEAFDEIWHVQKNLKDPESVWLLAGIQQVS
ncbi:Tim44 domain-containing protein [Nitrosovibrio sp. Nv4]|uniref:Tim44 domain-containing protein n=1 Tax=Nitrosovibrio sp. Nv4 TaxID=1945880 RepID=UPI000BC86B4C|nr:TIM44-like domain-containing protein [Nitrosovibrio sp. Nv4]SOD41157.1 Predicted lipid-binding transport protein, Tim44 family [Nitrosovibrio sp. Nv4]